MGVIPTFKNPFLSIAGQVERVKNVANVLTAAVTGNAKIYATTKSATANKVLESSASHPFVTAGVVAAVAPGAVKAIGGSVVKTGLPALKSAATAIGKSPTAGKIAAAGGAVLLAGGTGADIKSAAAFGLNPVAAGATTIKRLITEPNKASTAKSGAVGAASILIPAAATATAVGAGMTIFDLISTGKQAVEKKTSNLPLPPQVVIPEPPQVIRPQPTKKEEKKVVAPPPTPEPPAVLPKTVKKKAKKKKTKKKKAKKRTTKKKAKPRKKAKPKPKKKAKKKSKKKTKRRK